MIVKHYSKDAVHIPPRYFYDSTFTTNGKPDTAWHQVSDIELTNQFGQQVKLSDAAGKVLVVDFIFSRCPSICPAMTKNMLRLQNSYLKNPEMVQFVSISVDPEHDSAHNLRKFADRFGVNHDSWWFLTGDKKAIYDFSINEMKASIADTKVDTAFIHTQKFFLVDTNRVVRGFYDGLDTLELKRLARDIPILSLEKTKNSKSIFRSFIPILPIIFIAIALVFVVMYFVNKKKKDVTAIP